MASPGTGVVTDVQWSILNPPIPEPKRRPDGRGRPWRDRRFQQWVRSRVNARRIGSLGVGFGGRRKTRSTRSLYRREFCSRPKRGLQVGKPIAARSKITAVADRSGLPIAVCTACAAPHEVTLVETTLAETVVPTWPERLIGDAAYESDSMDRRLALLGVTLVAPPQIQSETPHARWKATSAYRRCWKIERLPGRNAPPLRRSVLSDSLPESRNGRVSN